MKNITLGLESMEVSELIRELRVEKAFGRTYYTMASVQEKNIFSWKMAR